LKVHTAGIATIKPEGRRDQGFRDAAATAPIRGLLDRNLLEGVQDTHDRSEESYEGSRRTDRGQATKATLELGVDNRFGAVKGPLAGLDLLLGDRGAVP